MTASKRAYRGTVPVGNSYNSNLLVSSNDLVTLTKKMEEAMALEYQEALKKNVRFLLFQK